MSLSRSLIYFIVFFLKLLHEFNISYSSYNIEILSFVMDSTRNERGVKIQRQIKERRKTQDSENSNCTIQYRRGCGGGWEVNSRSQSETKLPPVLSGNQNPTCQNYIIEMG